MKQLHRGDDGVPHLNNSDGYFQVKRAAVFNVLQCKIGTTLAKASALRIDINLKPSNYGSAFAAAPPCTINKAL